MTYRLQFEHWIPLPLEQVFQFFEDPKNLPQIMPVWMQVKLEQLAIVLPSAPAGVNAAGAGSRLVASFRAVPFLPFRIRSEARITSFSANEYFEDVQGRGPFQSWHHRHEFAPETRNGIPGTRVRDQVEYAIGFEPMGKFLNALFIAPQIRRTFAYRRQAVERVLGVPKT